MCIFFIVNASKNKLYQKLNYFKRLKIPADHLDLLEFNLNFKIIPILKIMLSMRKIYFIRKHIAG
jgi:hypothetical protein